MQFFIPSNDMHKKHFYELSLHYLSFFNFIFYWASTCSAFVRVYDSCLFSILEKASNADHITINASVLAPKKGSNPGIAVIRK